MKDIITLVIAIIGAGLGVFNTWASHRDRGERIKVVPKWALAPGFSGLSFNVINLGTGPVTIHEVGILIGRSRNELPHRLSIPNHKIADGPHFPVKIERGGSINITIEATDIPKKDYRKAYAMTALGKIFRGSSPALKQFINDGPIAPL